MSIPNMHVYIACAAHNCYKLAIVIVKVRPTVH